MSHLKERRQFKRFRPKDGTMAIDNHALGPVIDISMGGLSFRYVIEDAAKPISNFLGIFLSSDDILIDKLKTKLISDEFVSQSSSFLTSSTRKRSIQFVNLTETLRNSLKEFINTKTQETLSA